jgi:hypothetical protein
MLVVIVVVSGSMDIPHTGSLTGFSDGFDFIIKVPSLDFLASLIKIKHSTGPATFVEGNPASTGEKRRPGNRMFRLCQSRFKDVFGVELPRTIKARENRGRPIPIEALQAVDLV